MRSDIEVLGLLVQADEALDSRQPWQLYPTAAALVWIGGGGWPDGVQLPDATQLDDMAVAGWIRISEHVGDRGRKFSVTNLGRERWATHLAAQAHPPGRVEIGWDVARPLLGEIYERYLDAGAPQLGVDLEPLLRDQAMARQNAAIVRELFRDGWLERPEITTDQSNTARPTAKTTQIFGGWPSGAGQDALDELVRAVSTEIEATTDETKRSKLIALRDTLMSTGRELAIHYFERKVMGG